MGRYVALVFAALWVFGVAKLSAEEPARLWPRGLHPGDTIAIVAPARGVDPQQLERVKQRLEQRGYRVKHADDIHRNYGYLGGTDARRAEELMSAFQDPDVDAVFPFTGGYGTTRILDRLDFAEIQRHPKLLLGFSDITGLHLALQAKTSLITLHGPNPDGAWGREQPMNPYAEDLLWQFLTAEGSDAMRGYAYPLPPGQRPLGVLQSGRAEGVLTGGNLSLVAALMGTPYEIQTVGRVLFLEDVHEAPYRVDRYLSQLRLAGKLSEPAAVILGQFTDTDDEDDRPGLTMQQVFVDYFGGAAYPVVTHFPAGHVAANATLPLGARVVVEASATAARVQLAE